MEDILLPSKTNPSIMRNKITPTNSIDLVNLLQNITKTRNSESVLLNSGLFPWGTPRQSNIRRASVHLDRVNNVSATHCTDLVHILLSLRFSVYTTCLPGLNTLLWTTESIKEEQNNSNYTRIKNPSILS